MLMKCNAYAIFFCAALLFSDTISAEPVKAVRDATAETQADEFRPLSGFDPALWWIFKTNQNCQASFASESCAERLAIDFTFLGPGGIEYLEFGTPLAVRRDDLYLGIRATLVSDSGEPLECPFNPRFTDPSGETHQRPLDLKIGAWRIGKIDGRGLSWGGDGDGVLQLPAIVHSITMDRLSDGWKRSGRLTVEEVKFFTRRQIDDMIALELDGSDAMTNIFAPSDAEFALAIRVRNVADTAVDIIMRRQVNGVTLPDEAVEPNADGVLSYPKPNRAGYESVVFSPRTEIDGEKRLGAPMKFGFAVIDADQTRNRWCAVATHMNIGALDRMAAAGLGMIRDDATWAAVEKEPGVYQFPETWERYVERARQLNLEPLFIINYGNPLYDDGDFPHTDAARAAYARYAAEVAAHFKGRCRYYEIWNEWTGACGMGAYRKNGHNTPENYVLLLVEASKAIRAVDPDAYIIGGGGDHFTWHFDAVQKMMELGAMDHCDAFSIHPYIYPETPEKSDVIGKMKKIVDCMRTNGCESPKLWLTELGYPTYRGLLRNTPTALSQQDLEKFSAEMLVRSAILYKSMPEVEQFTWYDLENDGKDLEYNENNFGLLHNSAYGWQPKASWRAYAELSRELADATVTRNEALSTERRLAFDIVRPGKNRVVAAWTLDQTDSLPLDDVLRVTGLYGEALPLSTRTLTGAVTYFEIK